MFVDLVEREKMVEQAMGLDKKVKEAYGKRVRTISSQPLPKRTREFQGYWRSTPLNVRSKKGQAKQPSVLLLALGFLPKIVHLLH